MAALSSLTRLRLDARRFLGISAAERIRNELDLEIADRAYEPQVDDPDRDWVASVAAPAFRILRRRRGVEGCRSFCSIGTGAGVDALAGVELLGAETVGITDLFPEVVEAAAGNVTRNLQPSHAVALHAAAGDLLLPLAGLGLQFDVIYENLPNLPLADERRLEADRTSAAFVPPRDEPVPDFVRDWLLVLHYLALVQARDFLKPNGTVISTLGARLPLDVIFRMAEAAGYRPSFLTYAWKVQAEAVDVIGSYAAWQQQGLGPFHFYPAALLAAVFAGIDPEQAGRDALEIERELTPHRLDAVAAWDAFQRGERIGHTVGVLQSDRS